MDFSSHQVLSIDRFKQKIVCTITPPASKSESNRVLIIDALTGHKCQLSNLSNARDTQTMIRLLKSSDAILDVIDAGTTMRFLTAYLAITGQERVLTGTKRMCERPIKLLVDALKQLGASIGYMQKEGYPPLQINAFDKTKVKTNKLSINGDVSSQYITALLLIAPILPNGLCLELLGKVGSKPYIEMTLSLMKHFGVDSKWEGNQITIPAQEYKTSSYTIESDWSAASYWFSVVALSPEFAEVTLTGYRENSLQGDSVITELMKNCGVLAEFKDGNLVLNKYKIKESFSWDFTHCPDLAQTVAVVCAAKGIECTMSGLESLRIKETDRIKALQVEIEKFGGEMEEVIKDSTYRIVPQSFSVYGQTVATYKDHRMAMAFAPLALLGDINIESPEVTDKSYPHFWDDFKKAGILQ